MNVAWYISRSLNIISHRINSPDFFQEKNPRLKPIETTTSGKFSSTDPTSWLKGVTTCCNRSECFTKIAKFHRNRWWKKQIFTHWTSFILSGWAFFSHFVSVACRFGEWNALSAAPTPCLSKSHLQAFMDVPRKRRILNAFIRKRVGYKT